MIKKGLLVILVALGLTGCDKYRVFDEYKSLPNSWNRDSIVSFQVNTLDTTKRYDLFINVRNTNDYEYRNLFLVTRIKTPDNKEIIDTLEYEMAFPDGTWMGEGLNDNKASKLWYKSQIKFDESGTYQFDIRQAMRENGERYGIENLKGITEVGLRIEDTQN